MSFVIEKVKIYYDAIKHTNSWHCSFSTHALPYKTFAHGVDSCNTFFAWQAWLPHKYLHFCLSWESDSSGDGGAGQAASPGKPGSHINSRSPTVGAHSVGECAWVQPCSPRDSAPTKYLRFCLSWESDSSGDGGAGEAASPGKPGSHINSRSPSVGAHSVGEGIAWVQPVRRGTRLLQNQWSASAFRGSLVHRAMVVALAAIVRSNPIPGLPAPKRQ